jgi:glycosyltransferase involved in cell wall biosynthesis
MGKKILFLVPYPLHESPSQRFRFEQYFDLLRSKEYSCTIQTFLNKDNWKLFYSQGRHLSKGKALVSGFVKRIIAIFKSPMYDFVFIHREVCPVGPPVFEWILAKVLKRKVIYDFDDAVWLTDRKQESWILRMVKWRGKVRSICKWAHKVSCGNEYLCNYALLFNKDVVYNPTTIDTENVHNLQIAAGLDRKAEKIRIGWTGSHSTLKYLNEIEAVLNKIMNEYPLVEFMVIADAAPSLEISTLAFVNWKIETEIKDLLHFDIGIMPLPDDEWAKGKCGFKALQYMALGLPAVASPVGVNTKIIDQGVNGFLCTTSREWEQALKTLIENKELRYQMGKNGRKKVLDYYSLLSNSANFLSLFD